MVEVSGGGGIEGDIIDSIRILWQDWTSRPAKLFNNGVRVSKLRCHAVTIEVNEHTLSKG